MDLSPAPSEPRPATAPASPPRGLRTVAGSTAALILALIASQPARASPDAGVNIAGILHTDGLHFLATHPGTVGLSIGVAYQGAFYTDNFGTLSRTTTQRATAGTRYPIASVTKTFAATLLAEAVLDGKLKAEDDVRLHLDGRYDNLSRDGHAIRLYDLVDHRSQLPYFLPDLPQAQPDYGNNETPFLTRLARLRRNYTDADFFADLHTVKLLATPGTEPPHYSNAAVELMGKILAATYATSFEQLLRTKILNPVGMHDTCMAPACPDDTNPPRGYDAAGHQLPDDIALLGPAGAIKSSVNDLLKYMLWLHSDTNPAGRLSHTPRVVVGDYSVGLNWQMWTAHGNHLIWQSGNLPGFGALCVDQKESGVELVILMNGTGDATTDGKDALANSIAAQLDPHAVMLP